MRILIRYVAFFMLVLLSESVLSQQYAESTPSFDKLYKDVKVNRLFCFKEVDSVTFISCISVKKSGSMKCYSYMHTYNPVTDTYEVVSKQEVNEKAMRLIVWSTYIRKNNEIFRIRDEARGGILRCYLDKVTDKGVEEASEPFYSKKTDKLSPDDVMYVKKVGEVWVMACVCPPGMKDRGIQLVVLEKETFKVVKEKFFSTNHLDGTLKYIGFDQKYVLYSIDYEDDSKKRYVHLFSFQGNDFSELTYLDEKNRIKNCQLFGFNNTLNMYVFSANDIKPLGKTWKVEVFAVDLQKPGLIKTDSQNLSISESASSHNKNLSMLYELGYFYKTDVFCDADAIYIVGFTSKYGGGSWDYLVSKISDGKVVWSNYVYRPFGNDLIKTLENKTSEIVLSEIILPEVGVTEEVKGQEFIYSISKNTGEVKLIRNAGEVKVAR